jgi:uncharacterized protein (UPF0276 family)
MKKEIYASWCEGLPQSKNALKILKDSGMIIGIETCDLNEEIDLIKKSGLKVNVHNPLRKLRVGLEDKNLKKEMTPEKILLCKKSDEDFVGFHTCYKNLERSHSLVFARVRHVLNTKFLRKNLNKKIIFESRPYIKGLTTSKKSTSPNFIEQLLNYSNGYLFDISHNFVTMKNLGNEGKEYRKEILKVTGGKVLQIHLNCPLKKEGGDFIDVHGIFQGKDYEKEVLDFARDVIKNNPQLSVITLEMTTNSSPEEHVNILIQQAKYLKKKLDI